MEAGDSTKALAPVLTNFLMPQPTSQKASKLTVIVYYYRGLTHKQDAVVRTDHATVDGSNMDFAAISM
jgi:hypothetical protein